MYRLYETVRSSQDGEIVLDIRLGQMFRLNLAGSRILGLLKSGCDESDIVDDLSREFDIRRDLAEADVREFILLLKQHGLIEQSNLGIKP